MPERRSNALFATIRRWHFYAGLFVIPFLLLLAVSGGFYLFKPEVDRFEERAFRDLPTAAAVAAGRQVAAALAAVPGADFGSYRLPEQAGDAAMITLRLRDGAGTRQIFVAPEGQVLGSLDPERRLMALAKKLHSQLLLGPRASWLVELAACWAFVLMASGLYLWWPRGRRLAGVLWPRLGKGGRVRWRDLHAVTAFWLYGLITVLLLTSLPWTGVWGGAFQALRTELGLVDGTPEWTLGGAPPADPHAGHHGATGGMPGHGMTMATPVPAELDAMVDRARGHHLPAPVFVVPPEGLGRFGLPTGDLWTIYSDTQNRPRQRTLTFDPRSGALLHDRDADGGNRIDRIINYGIAWHEGQLFGWPNRLAGLLTTFGLVAMATSGLVMWRRRPRTATRAAPARTASPGASPPPNRPANAGVALAILLVLAAFLPLLALSLVALLLFDRLLRPRFRRWPAARWLRPPPS